VRRKHIKWAWKLLRSRNFIVVTDTEGVVNVEVADNPQFEDMMVLTQQAVALQMFQDKLEELAKQHDAELGGWLQKLDGGEDAPAPKKPKRTGKKASAKDKK
jgi:hypothetical protein